MLVIGFNEIDMAIIICCLICSAFSIPCNMSKENEPIATKDKVFHVESEKKTVDIVKFPPSIFADNDTYHAVETFRNEKK